MSRLYETKYQDWVYHLSDYESDVYERSRSELEKLDLFDKTCLHIILDYTKSWKQHFECTDRACNNKEYADDLFAILSVFEYISPIRQIILDYLNFTLDDIWQQTAFWKRNGRVNKNLYKLCEAKVDVYDQALSTYKFDPDIDNTILSSFVWTTKMNKRSSYDFGYMYDLSLDEPLDFLIIRLNLHISHDISHIFKDVSLEIGGQEFQKISSFHFLEVLLKLYNYRIRQTIIGNSQLIEIPIPFDFILNKNYGGMKKDLFLYHTATIRLNLQVVLYDTPEICIRYHENQRNGGNGSYVTIIAACQYKLSICTNPSECTIDLTKFTYPNTFLFFYCCDSLGKLIPDNNLIRYVHLDVDQHYYYILEFNGWNSVTEFPGMYFIVFSEENPFIKLNSGTFNFAKLNELAMHIQFDTDNTNMAKITLVKICGMSRHISLIDQGLCVLNCKRNIQ
jgi:hypothetical protein